MQQLRLINNSSQFNMFRAIILPTFRSTILCVTACGITQSSAPEDGQNNCRKHVELIGIINRPLLLHLVGCLYYLKQQTVWRQNPFTLATTLASHSVHSALKSHPEITHSEIFHAFSIITSK